MKRSFSIVLITSFIIFSLYLPASYGSSLWNFTYKESGDDAYLSVYTNSNIIVATGYAMSQYPLISIWKQDGTKLIDKVILTGDGAMGIASTYYKGYIYTTGVIEKDTSDIFLAKISPSTGKLLFLKVIGGNGTDEPRAIVGANDKIFIVGNTNSTDGDIVCGENESGIILSFDTGGNVLWNTCIQMGDTTELNDIYPHNNELYIVGTTMSDFLSDILVINTDTNGNTLWQKTIGGNDYDYGYGITGNKDSLFIAGTTFSDNIPGFHGKRGIASDGYIASLSYDGTLKWQKAVGGSKDDELFDITNTFLGPIAAGYTTSKELPGYTGDEDFFIAYTTDYGKTRYLKAWGSSQKEELWSISSSKNDIIYTDGWTYSDGILIGNIFAIDEDGSIVPTSYPIGKAITLKVWESNYLKGEQMLAMDKGVFSFIDPRYSRSLVPIRFVAEGLGYQVDWNSTDRTVSIKGIGKTILIDMKDALKYNTTLSVKKPTGEYIHMVVYEGSDIAKVNGKTTKLSAKPLIYNGRTFVPIRFISETLGSTVKWIPPDGIRIVP